MDRAKAMAYVMEEAERCSFCGTTDREWDEDRFAFVPVEHFCRGCYLERSYSDDREMLPGTVIRLVHRKSPEAMRYQDLNKRFGPDLKPEPVEE